MPGDDARPARSPVDPRTAGEVEAQLDRLEGAVERAQATPRPDVICHTDFGSHNALVDDKTGGEHDLWAAFEEPDPQVYFDALWSRRQPQSCAP